MNRFKVISIDILTFLMNSRFYTDLFSKRVIIPLVIATGTLLIFSSCYREKLVGEYYLSDEMKAQNPFHGFEDLFFVDDSGSVFKFAGEERISKTEKRFKDHTHRDFIYYEVDHIYFLNQVYQLEIGMSTYTSGYNIGISFTFLDGGLSFYSNYTSELNESQPNYLDSLLLNNVWIYDVFYDTMKFSNIIPLPDELLKYPIRSYYSADSGVVKIDFSDKTSWELEKVEW